MEFILYISSIVTATITTANKLTPAKTPEKAINVSLISSLLS